jgi:aminoglycoside phosphotransferase (APT) family kinase protein
MTAIVERDGAFALKIFPQRPHSAITFLVALTNALQSSGVPTPETSMDLQARAIRLPWIEGSTLKQRLACNGPVRTPSELLSKSGEFAAAMEVIGRLHLVDLVHHEIPVLNPFRHIDRRLREGSAVVERLPGSTVARAKRCRARLGARLHAAVPCGIVHGDFHAGQMILETAASKWWLLDLDDVALGCPEADLGNFAAHLVTSCDLYRGSVADGFRRLAALLGDAYGDVARARLAEDRIRTFGAAALLRRSLKLVERGAAVPPVDEILAACEGLIA